MSELATTRRKRPLTIRLAGLAVSGAVLATILPACAVVTPTNDPAPPAATTTTVIRPVMPAASAQPGQVPQSAPVAQAQPAGQAQAGIQAQPTAQTGTLSDGSSSSAPASTGSEAGNAAEQEELWLSQQPTPAQIWAEPACDDSFNGCAP